MILKILLLIILIFVNGVFSATEIAFLSLNKYKLKKMCDKGNKKALKIRTLLNDSSTFLSSIQIAITLSGFLASAFAAESFASELSNIINISFLDKGTLTSILVIIITMILSYFTLVFGELVPKKIGLVYSEKISFGMVNIIQVIIKVFKPFILVLKYSVDFIIKLLKIKPLKESDEDSLKNNISDIELDELEKNIMLNTFNLDDTKVKKIMTKLDKMIYIDVSDSKEVIVDKLRKYKFTRFPVIENNEIIGLLNIKDMIINHKENNNIKDYVRNMMVIDSSMIIDDAFLLLKSNREVMAMVVENDIVLGIITIEDIVEEIVGEIYDEYN